MLMVLTKVEDTSRYGRVCFDDARRIQHFAEIGQDDEGWINAGICCLHRSFIEAIRPNEKYSLERDLLPQYLQSRVDAYLSSGSFIDIGTIESYASAAEFFKGPP